MSIRSNKSGQLRWRDSFLADIVGPSLGAENALGIEDRPTLQPQFARSSTDPVDTRSMVDEVTVSATYKDRFGTPVRELRIRVSGSHSPASSSPPSSRSASSNVERLGNRGLEIDEPSAILPILGLSSDVSGLEKCSSSQSTAAEVKKPFLVTATDDMRTTVMTDDMRTTVMLRDIPNKLTASSLLRHLEPLGYTSRTYNFVYVPMDFRNKCNMGYAFFNFRSHGLAVAFTSQFAGYTFPGTNSKKSCNPCWANTQGLANLIEVYKTYPIPREYAPLLFGANGEEMEFPGHESDREPAQHASATVQREVEICTFRTQREGFCSREGICGSPSTAVNGSPWVNGSHWANGSQWASGSAREAGSRGHHTGGFSNRTESRSPLLRDTPLSGRDDERKVFVGGIPETMTKLDLARQFERFGPVKDAVVVLDRTSGRSRGFGFVSFFARSTAERAALQSPRTDIVEGCSVTVRKYKPRTE